MLRDSIKYELLASVVLNDERFWKFFDYVQGGSFDVSSDAFSTFKVTWVLQPDFGLSRYLLSYLGSPYKT